jgi:hypothetical protein
MLHLDMYFVSTKDFFGLYSKQKCLLQKMKRKRGKLAGFDEEKERGKRKVKRRENCEKIKIGKGKKGDGKEGRERKEGGEKERQ